MKTYILENEQLRAVIREKSAELISLQKKETGEDHRGESGEIPGTGALAYRESSF